jgi:ABC-2 type transport system permease protein
MSTTLTHSWFMTMRHLRNLARQPWWIAITLVQPIIWLLLFGAVFKATADIPGFAADSYVDFLTPGIVVMTAAFAGGWAGMGVIEDLNRGVIDRFLVSPVKRQALITGRLVQLAIVSLIQSLIVIGLGLLVGARFPGGLAGLAVLIGCSALLGGSLSALSNGMALLARKEETVIAASNFILLPLTFLSSAFMQRDLVPGWIQSVGQVQPGRVDRPGGPRGAHRVARLGSGPEPGRPVRRLHLAGHPGLPGLPALHLTPLRRRE